MPKLIQGQSNPIEVLPLEYKTVLYSTRLALSLTTDLAESSKILLTRFFFMLEEATKESVVLSLTDHDLLVTLDKHRNKAGYLCLDHSIVKATLNESDHTTTTVDLYDLASYAYRYQFFLSMNTLLREEEHSWGGHLAMIHRSSTREVVNQTTWFHKVLLLVSSIYEQHKDDLGARDGLKAYLQSWLQSFLRVMNEQVGQNKLMRLSHLKAFILKQDKPMPCALAFLKLFMRDEDEELNTPDILSLIEEFDLTRTGLIERTRHIALLAKKDTEMAEIIHLKAFLKSEFKACAMTLDRYHFKQCLESFNELHLEALTELILEYYSRDSSNDEDKSILYLIHSLSKEQSEQLLNYLFTMVDLQVINNHIEKNLPGATEEAQALVLVRTLQSLYALNDTIINRRIGDYQQQCAFFYRSMMARLPLRGRMDKERSYFNNVGIYFSTNIQIFKHLGHIKPTDLVLDPQTLLTLRQYPLIMGEFSKQLNGFHATILESLQRFNDYNISTIDFVCKDFCRTYLYLMWLDIHNISEELFEDKLQIADYWLETLFAHHDKYPKLFNRLTAVLLETNYLYDRRLAYYFKYKLPDKRPELMRFRELDQDRDAKKYQVFQTLCQPDLFARLELTKDSQKKALKQIFNKALSDPAREHSLFAQSDYLNGFLMAYQIFLKSTMRLEVNSDSLYLFIVSYLFYKTPIATQLERYAFSINKKGLDMSVMNYLLQLVSEKAAFSSIDYSALLDTIVFTQESARTTLLLFLFIINTGEHKTYPFLIPFIKELLTQIGLQFTHRPDRIAALEALFEDLAKHDFLVVAHGSWFKNVLFKHYLMPEPKPCAPEPAPSHSALLAEVATKGEPTELSLDELVASLSDTKSSPPLEKPARRKKKGPTQMPLTTITTEYLAETAVIALPEKPPIEAPYIPDDDGSSTSLSTEGSDTTATKDLNILPLKILREALSFTLSQMIALIHSKVTELSEEKKPHQLWKNIEAQLLNTKKIVSDIRAVLKKKSPKIITAKDERPLEPIELNLMVLCRRCNELIQQLLEAVAKTEGCESIIKLSTELTMPKSEDLEQATLQDSLCQHLRYPNMGILNQFISYFSEEAHIFYYGSALYLDHPLDLDLKIQIKNYAVPLQVARDKFYAFLKSQGLQLVSEPRDNIIGGLSFSIKGKGDGYDEANHKPISVTLLVGPPESRPANLHHNSHSSAALDLATGLIHCHPEFTKDIINNVFSIIPFSNTDPTQTYNANVHIINTLVRAWAAAQAGQLRLSPSTDAFLKRLCDKDPLLNAPLHGMIYRHFTHAEDTPTYVKRTEILFNFLKYINFNTADIPRILSEKRTRSDRAAPKLRFFPPATEVTTNTASKLTP